MVKMKESKYNMYLPMTNGGVLIYNTLYASAVTLSDDEYHVLKVESANLPPDIMDELFKNRILVPEDLDELQTIMDIRHSAIESSEVFDLILLSSMDCNFSCYYCYETKRKVDMTDAVCESVINLIKSISKEHKLIRVCWFGGEPLLNVNPIVKVSKYVHNLSKCIDCAIETHVTTNGYLLTSELANLLVPLGVNKFMITVDGVQKTHDISRPLIGGLPSYSTIIKNIKKLIKNPVEITLRVNFNAKNAIDLTPLFEEFEPRYRKQITVLIEPIFGEDNISAVGTMPRGEVLRYMDDMYKLVSKLGYKTFSSDISISPRKTTYCYAERKSQVIISPEGDVYKCPVHDLCGNTPYGKLLPDGNIIYNTEYEAWMKYGENLSDLCRVCECLPICMCSCRRTVQMALFEGKQDCVQRQIIINRVVKFFRDKGFDPIQHQGSI